jgi:hypothetical protein
MARRQVSIFINGRAVENTLKSIGEEKRKINRELKNMVIGTEEYERKAGDLRKVNDILDKHYGKIRNVNGLFGKITSGVTKFAGVAGLAFGVGEIIGYGKQLFDLSVKMDTLNRKAATVFGQALPAITAAARENATAMGLTSQQYVAAATELGDLLIPMGLQRQEAADISLELVNLSGALSEWTGGQRTSEEVSRTLAKALLGEREELKQLGISIKESDVQNRLREKGLASLTGKFLEQAKAVATLELITEKSVDAQNSYAENSDSLVRRQAELTAKVEDLQERLATALLPVLERLFSVVETGAGLMVELAEAFDLGSTSAKNVVDSVFEQEQAFSDLEAAFSPLIQRYDELSAKTSLSGEEQQELKQLIVDIGRVTPGAITEIDKYGNALAISGDKARELVAAERARLKFLNSDAAADIEKQIRILEEERNKYLITIKSEGNSFAFTKARAEAARAEVEKINQMILGANAELDRLLGRNIPNPEAAPDAPATDDEPEVDLEAEAEAEARAAAAEKAAEKLRKQRIKHLEKLAEITAKYREEQRLATLTDADREEEEIRLKYQRQIDLATELERAGYDQATAQRIELEQLRDEELEALQLARDQARREREIAREEELFIEDEERRRERAERRAEIEAEIDAKVRETVLSERELAILELEEYYDRLEAQARLYGIDTLELEITRRRALAELNEEYDAKQLKQDEAAQKARVEVTQKALGQLANAVQAGYDLMIDSGAEAAGAAKILALIQIGIKSAEALASATASAAALPFPANLGAIAGAVGTVLSIMGQARSVLNSTPAVPQRAEGSYFTVQGEDDGKTYSARHIGRPRTGMLPRYPVLIDSVTGASVLGSERGAEYFVAHNDLRNPAVMQHVSAIERIRQRVDGGFSTADGSAPGRAGVPADEDDRATPDYSAFFAEALAILRELTEVLDRGLLAVMDDESALNLRDRLAALDRARGLAA